MQFTIVPNEDKQRIDKVLAQHFPDFSRSFLQSLCKQDKVLINNQPQKSGYKVSWGDTVNIQHDMTEIGVVPDITMPVIYEDEHVLVVNKPAGVLSHALSKFKDEPSVASFLRQKSKLDSPAGDNIRYGIVHRLDRATSGVMVCAKTPEATTHLQQQFADRSVEKTYVAVVSNTPKHEKAHIDVPIERNPKKPATFRVGTRGKAAYTSYKLRTANETYSLLELQPRTGRTHQLRVHLAYIGCPIVGDFLYNGEEAERLFLHAHSLRIKDLHGKSVTYTAPIPPQFEEKVA